MLAVLALLGWLAARFGPLGRELSSFGLHGANGAKLDYLYVDASALVFAVAAFVWMRTAPGPRLGWALAGLLALASFAHHAVMSLSRYYFGSSRAWDLANYVQPMWRAAHGLDMASGAYQGKPVWADHGAFAMFAFAPLTTFGDDAATPVLLAQALVVALSVLAAYGLARALDLSPAHALIGAAVLFSSRALAHAVRFDFHAECLMPLALLATAWAYERDKLRATVVGALVVLTLRDMAALTAMMLWLYYALRARAQTRLPIVLVGVSALVAVLDIALLPRWTGWVSYLALNTSAPLDVPTAVQTTVMRGLSTFGLGWLHPITWLSGAPWAAAAAGSPKLGVKSIDFQYSFVFVPVALLGALYALRQLQLRLPRHADLVTGVWAALAVSVNAPLQTSTRELWRARSVFDEIRSGLRELVPEGASVGADSCAAPYVMERLELTPLCRVDLERLQVTGIERWDYALPEALRARYIVVRKDCPANDRCVADQVARAQSEHGFHPAGGVGPFVVLARNP